MWIRWKDKAPIGGSTGFNSSAMSIQPRTKKAPASLERGAGRNDDHRANRRLSGHVLRATFASICGNR